MRDLIVSWREATSNGSAFLDGKVEGLREAADELEENLPVVDRRVIREHLERHKRYFATRDGGISYGAVADVVIKVLAEHYGIKVCDCDWS